MKKATIFSKSLGLSCITILCASLLSISQTYSQSKPLGLDNVDPEYTVKEVFSGGEGLLLEGPSMSPEGILYFTDIIIPDNSPSNLCFGTGKWSNTLFITARKKLYMVDINKSAP